MQEWEDREGKEKGARKCGRERAESDGGDRERKTKGRNEGSGETDRPQGRVEGGNGVGEGLSIPFHLEPDSVCFKLTFTISDLAGSSWGRPAPPAVSVMFKVPVSHVEADGGSEPARV